MAELIASLFIGIGALLVLMFAAEQAVKRILLITDHYGFSATFAGLTIFSIATSFPEIFTSVIGSFDILTNTLDYNITSAVVLGANIGSDVIQQTLIFGLVVFIAGDLFFKKEFIITSYIPMILTTLLLLTLAWDRTLSRLDGFILLGAFIGYVYYLYRKENGGAKKKVRKNNVNIAKETAISLLCIGAMLASAHFLLKIIQQLVVITGLGGSLIGVVSLGVASATPELFTAIAGMRHKAPGITLGTLVGSNLTNPLVAIGGGALLSTYAVPLPLIHWDLPMEALTAALLLPYLWYTKGKLDKPGAVFLIVLYVIYIGLRIMYFPFD